MKNLNEKEFTEAVKSGICVVDFYATWCGPCKMMAPILQDIEEELGSKAKFFKIDVDENENLARKFGVMSIPTILILENGKECERKVGLWQRQDAFDTINSYLN